MTKRLLLLLLPFLLVSCSARTGEILPPITRQAGTLSPTRLPAVFPAGRWQFVHSISFTLPSGNQGTALGVLVLNKQSVHCALMSSEGLSLFQAGWTGNGPIDVSRALPPFNKQGFAEGLAEDIRTIFRKPPGISDCGHLEDGSPICRYSAPKKTTDILPQKDGCWTMFTYAGQQKVRTIHTDACTTRFATIIPENIQLVYAGPAGYTLTMHLISAEKIKPAK